jgi:hypothetical protein
MDLRIGQQSKVLRGCRDDLGGTAAMLVVMREEGTTAARARPRSTPLPRVRRHARTAGLRPAFRRSKVHELSSDDRLSTLPLHLISSLREERRQDEQVVDPRPLRLALCLRGGPRALLLSIAQS